MTEQVPSEVRRLLTVVDSYEKLELLSLTTRQPEMIWTPELAATSLRVSEEILSPAIEALTAVGLLAAVDGGFRFAGSNAGDRAAAELLARTYEADRFEILKILNAVAYERIRHSAARAFADAFRIRRDPGKDDDDG